MKPAPALKEDDLPGLIDVQFAATCNSIGAATIKSWCVAALEDEPRNVCVRIVDEKESSALNARYRNCQSATNVLAFGSEIPGCLGDVIVCIEVATAEAKSQAKSTEAHLAHLVVHGVLHLRGFDHEHSAQAAEMEAKEIGLLKSIGISNPYEI